MRTSPVGAAALDAAVWSLAALVREHHSHMETMKAVCIHQYGGPDVLHYEDVPKPAVGPDEVLVRVHAAAINPVDWKVRQGYLHKALPMIPGWDVSGVIEACGSNVRDFAVGDEVFGRPDLARNGAYAEYIAVRAQELARKPRSLDHIHAAAVPLAGLTAWQALFQAVAPYSAVDLQPGQKILIHAGAGGVGSFAVQLAKWKGAHVWSTASTANQQLLRNLGAARPIDYTREQFEDVARDMDVVFDTVGGEVQQRSWKCLRPGGTLVSIVSPPSPEEADAHAAKAAYVFVQPHAPQLAELARLIDNGTIKPVIAQVFPLAEARRAHELSQSGHARGKIVLKVH